MTADVWLIITAVVLVLLAGLLTMAETAIGRVSRSQFEEARKDGDRRAERLLAVLADRPRHVNVLLFLSTVASVTATVLVGYVSVDLIAVQGGGSPALALLVAVATMVVAAYVVVGVAARTLGRQHAERIAMAAASPSYLLATILGPLANGAIGTCLGTAIGLSVGGAAVLGTLAASASYIAAPAAVRLALPAANPGFYLTAALGITFPFNLLLGLPLYVALSRLLHG